MYVFRCHFPILELKYFKNKVNNIHKAKVKNENFKWEDLDQNGKYWEGVLILKLFMLN